MRFWKTLWSTSVSSPLTETQLPSLVSWKSLRDKRLCDAPAGMLREAPPRNLKPRSTTFETPLAKENVFEPVMVALPTCSAVTVTGADVVPDRLTASVELAAYEPSARAIVSPGFALSSADCSAGNDVTRTCAADAAGPGTTTSAATIRGTKSRRIRQTSQ